MTIRVLQGDCRDLLPTLPANSVHTVVTSPPYYALRSYLDADHPDKHREIGSEATPDEYIATMVAVFREVRRVLRYDGTCWVNMGDSYNNFRSQMGPGQAVHGRDDLRSKPEPNSRTRGWDGLKEKDLLMMPARLALALQAPYYTGTIKSEADRIWLAAMIDTEGCMFIHKRKGGTPNYASYTKKDGTTTNYTRLQDTYGAGLEIANTSRAIVERCLAIVGQGSIGSQSPEQNDRRKQTIYRWHLRSNECREVVREIYPHLVAKQQQARILIGCPSTGDKAAAAHAALIALHNGDPTDMDFPEPASMFEPGWYVRSDIIWKKPNPMPESVTDRPTNAHEHVFLLTKSGSSTFWTHRDHAGSHVQPLPDYRWLDADNDGAETAVEPDGWREDRKRWRRINLWTGHDYYYDADAVREEATKAPMPMQASEAAAQAKSIGPMARGNGINHQFADPTRLWAADGGRNLRNVWSIATAPFSEWGETSRQVRVAWDAPDDGKKRKASPDCPVHAGHLALVSSAHGDARADGSPNRTERSDSRLAQAQAVGSSLTGLRHKRLNDGQSSGLPLLECAGVAIPHSTQSHRTDLDPATSPACSVSAQTADDTGRIPASPLLFGSVDHMPESNSEQDESDDRPSAQTGDHSADMSSCSCEWYIEVTEKTSHFATFPPALAERCIKAGTSERGCCAQCGSPWVRQTAVSYAPADRTRGRPGEGPFLASGAGNKQGGWNDYPSLDKHSTTTGWAPGCQCIQKHATYDNHADVSTAPCTVLDPFAGAGTTGLVADRLQRNAVLIELSPAYCAMLRNRITQDAPLFAEVTDAPA